MHITLKSDGDLMGLLFSLAFTGIGVALIYFHLKELKHSRIKGKEVIATIIKISRRNRRRKVFVSYDIEGKEHLVKLNCYSTSMKVGNSIKLYVDKENPENYFYAGFEPLIGGAVFIIFGIGIALIM